MSYEEDRPGNRDHANDNRRRGSYRWCKHCNKKVPVDARDFTNPLPVCKDCWRKLLHATA